MIPSTCFLSSLVEILAIIAGKLCQPGWSSLLTIGKKPTQNWNCASCQVTLKSGSDYSGEVNNKSCNRRQVIVTSNFSLKSMQWSQKRSRKYECVSQSILLLISPAKHKTKTLKEAIEWSRKCINQPEAWAAIFVDRSAREANLVQDFLPIQFRQNLWRGWRGEAEDKEPRSVIIFERLARNTQTSDFIKSMQRLKRSRKRVRQLQTSMANQSRTVIII